MIIIQRVHDSIVHVSLFMIQSCMDDAFIDRSDHAPKIKRFEYFINHFGFRMTMLDHLMSISLFHWLRLMITGQHILVKCLKPELGHQTQHNDRQSNVHELQQMMSTTHRCGSDQAHDCTGLRAQGCKHRAQLASFLRLAGWLVLFPCMRLHSTNRTLTNRQRDPKKMPSKHTQFQCGRLLCKRSIFRLSHFS